MTNQEKKDGNLLLADFDGIKIGVSNYSWRPGCIEPIQEQHLNYHDSWGWMMGLVEKIEGLPIDPVHGKFGVYISSNNCGIQATNFRPHTNKGQECYFRNHYGETKLEATWQACVCFIKWHNEKTKLTIQ